MAYRIVHDDRFAHPVYLPPETASANRLYEGGRAREALDEFERLAADGSAPARSVLAVLHLTGNLDLGINRDLSRQLCEKDAIDGYSYAQYVMAWICVENGFPLDGVQWMRRAARAGFPPALLDMGRLYLNGVGVAKDREIALDWLRKARRAGHVLAHRFALQQYRSGRFGVARKILARLAWPFSSLYLAIRFRVLGPYDDKWFFYNWPKVAANN